MRIDTGRVRQRAEYVRTQVRALRALAARGDADAFAQDAVAAAPARYLLQTSIEVLIDLAYHLSAKLAQHAPRNAHDAFDTMARLGILDAAGMPRRHEMLRFRNRVVRGYLDVDDRRIHAMMVGRELNEIVATLAALEAAALGGAAERGVRAAGGPDVAGPQGAGAMGQTDRIDPAGEAGLGAAPSGGAGGGLAGLGDAGGPHAG